MSNRTFEQLSGVQGVSKMVNRRRWTGKSLAHSSSARSIHRANPKPTKRENILHDFVSKKNRLVEKASWSIPSVQIAELAPKLYILTRRTPKRAKPDDIHSFDPSLRLNRSKRWCGSCGSRVRPGKSYLFNKFHNYHSGSQWSFALLHQRLLYTLCFA